VSCAAYGHADAHAQTAEVGASVHLHLQVVQARQALHDGPAQAAAAAAVAGAAGAEKALAQAGHIGRVEAGAAVFYAKQNFVRLG